MKSSNVKKVLSIIILCLVVAVTLTTIILAVIPKKLYNPVTDGYYTVNVYKDKKNNLYVATENADQEDKDFIKKLNELQQKSVQDNILSALFQGTSKFEERVVYESSAIDAMSKVANVAEKVCLIFNYLDNQTLMMNGKPCTHASATGENNTIIYTKMFMEISDTDQFEECTIYLTGSDNKSNYQIKFLAHQSDIYEYLTGLTWDVV